MPIDKTIFTLNYTLMFDSMHPFDYIVEEGGIFRCTLTWVEAKKGVNFLPHLIEHSKTAPCCGNIIWFQKGDSYSGSKPFEINWIGLETVDDVTSIILVVDGKKTQRIENKWPGKLSPFFGYPVNIIWEGDAQ